MRAHAVVAVCLLMTSWSAVSVAQEPEPPATAESLEQRLDELEPVVNGADCDAACSALASMMRAADELCELEPGERCEAAKKRVAAAKERVRKSCPDCVAARSDDDTGGDADVEEEQQGGPVPEPATEDSVQAAKTDGGCATCAVGGPSSSPRRGLLGLLLVGAALCRRWGRRSSP
jgi:MYXO-CTERM domain-containing protein